MTIFQVLRGYLRIFGWNGFLWPAQRTICALLLALLLPVAACAYTVVLRSGRRIEIPSQFTVTSLTLTYETAPGINITLLMSSINVAATERANGEPTGSLLKRTEKPAIVNTASTQTRPPRRELMQADIEAARLARQKSEQDYERRRKELGLPSLEELRRRTEAETKRLKEVSAQSELEEAQAEAYWRERANELMAAIATLDAQINYIQSSLAGASNYSTVGEYTFSAGFAPAFPLRRPFIGRPGLARGFNNTGAGFQIFGGVATPGPARLSTGLQRGNLGGRSIATRGLGFPSVTVIGLPFSNYNYSYDSATLASQLYALQAERAGLQARWQLLEEEARRAGAQPGWLRP
jgi:uncharacterized protein YukE